MLGRRARPASGLCAPAFTADYAPEDDAYSFAPAPYTQPNVPQFQQNYASPLNNAPASYGMAHVHRAPPQLLDRHDAHFVPAHARAFSNGSQFAQRPNPYQQEPFQRNVHRPLNTVYPVA
jgi:hypothetical protein